MTSSSSCFSSDTRSSSRRNQGCHYHVQHLHQPPRNYSNVVSLRIYEVGLLRLQIAAQLVDALLCLAEICVAHATCQPRWHISLALSSWMLDNETKTFVFTLFAPPCARQISGSQACASQPHELQACMGHSYEPYKRHESATFTKQARWRCLQKSSFFVSSRSLVLQVCLHLHKSIVARIGTA